ncbi:MAG: phytoene/squalene synthase family protein [Candidatus Micrarchaeota archaeon]
MPKVSRSFALAIRLLPSPLGDQMMISYLIYRIIDTIEDSNLDAPRKKELFDAYTGILRGGEYCEQKTLLVRRQLIDCLTYSYESSLLESLEKVSRAYYSQPPLVRKSILRWGRVMAQGMYEFQKKQIRTFADQDAYSYYVAGVVGYLFNDLLYHNKIITQEAKKRLHVHAKRFGLALQKVNILRDVASDVPSQRYYWPKDILARHGLDYDTLLDGKNRQKAMSALNEEIENALEYLYSGMQYIVSLPKNALKVRMFCIIPLFMAIESYVKCINNNDVFDSQKKVKITRAQVHEIVAKSTLWGTSNEKLVRWFVKSMKKASPKVEGEYAPLLLKVQKAA